MNKSIYSTDYKFLINQLKKARKEARLTQKEVAKKLGKTQSYISKIEAGDLRIDVIQLKEFAELYKRNLEHFIKQKN